jgi:hypothetical protein
MIMKLSLAFERFFGVATRGQTYLNMLYLLVSFPLGLLYFVFLVTGLSVGISTLIIWIGLLVLLAVFTAWYGLLVFERQLAIWMLKEDIPPMARPDAAPIGLWQKFVSALKNSVTWKGLVYLFARFPIGIFSFVVLVSLLATSASLIAAPFYYQYVAVLQPQVVMSINGVSYSQFLIDTPIEAGLACLAGILVMLGSMHIFNGLAWLSGRFARVMLGNFAQ